jgi:hypothetical protein
MVMNPNKIKTFICKRCSLEKQGHFNTKFCNDWYYRQGWECTVVWEDQTPEIIEHLQDISAGKL